MPCVSGFTAVDEMSPCCASETCAGFPYDVLAHGHFVPGTERWSFGRYKGKDQWKQVMDITDDVCTLYFGRVNLNFNAAVTKDFSQKMKDGDASESFHVRCRCQKQQQLSLEEHETLIDVCCLWSYIRPKLQGMITEEYFQKLSELFLNGTLVSIGQV